MSDEPEETTYYLRLMSMYMDLGTEIALKVFIHHSPNKDAENFLKSKHLYLEELKRNKVLNKEEYDKARVKPPDLKRFDISLLITLSINLFTENQLTPPDKGWDKPPRNKDKSIGADLLRLRKIRNVIVGHHHAARLPKWRFDNEWENVSEILLRIQQDIAKENEAELQQKIEEYRLRSLDSSSVKDKHDPKLKKWHDEVSEIQNQVEDLIKKLEGFDVYFKNRCDRYERYMKLLIKGGRFVLSALLQKEMKKQKRDLRSILDDNKQSVVQRLTNSKHEHILFPSESDSSQTSLDVFSWDASLSAAVILVVFENSIGRAVKRSVQRIESAHKNYVDKALTALDSNQFEECSTDLKTSIEVLSDFLDEDQAKECYEILEECKKKTTEKEFKTFMDELKSQGSQMKTLTDVHKDLIRETKDALQEMITKGISFKNNHDLEMKIITLGTNEEKKNLAEEILTEVWHEALHRSAESTDFPEIKKEVMKILTDIRKSDSVKNITIKKECILLKVTCSLPSHMLNLINYFESDIFHITLRNILSELGFYLNTAFAVHAVLTIDSLWEIMNRHDEVENSNIRLPITVSSPAGMMKLRSLLKSEKVAKSTATMADALSRHLDETITLNICTDMKELEGVIDEGKESSDSCDSSSTENDAQDGFSVRDQPGIKTEKDTNIQGIKTNVETSTEEHIIKQTDGDMKVKNGSTTIAITSELETDEVEIYTVPCLECSSESNSASDVPDSSADFDTASSVSALESDDSGFVPELTELARKKSPGVSFSEVFQKDERKYIFKEIELLNKQEPLEIIWEIQKKGKSILSLKKNVYNMLGQALEMTNTYGEDKEPWWNHIIDNGDLDISRKEQKEIAKQRTPGLEFLDILNDRGYTIHDLEGLFSHFQINEALDILRIHQDKGPDHHNTSNIQPSQEQSNAGSTNTNFIGTDVQLITQTSDLSVESNSNSSPSIQDELMTGSTVVLAHGDPTGKQSQPCPEQDAQKLKNDRIHQFDDDPGAVEGTRFVDLNRQQGVDNNDVTRNIPIVLFDSWGQLGSSSLTQSNTDDENANSQSVPASQGQPSGNIPLLSQLGSIDSGTEE